MLKIWIVEYNPSEIQCFIDEAYQITPTKNFITIEKTLLEKYYTDWEVFLHRIYPLKKLKPLDEWEKEILPLFYEKAKLLENLLFRNTLYHIIPELESFQEIVFVVDAFTARLPIEILIYKEESSQYFSCLYERFHIIRQIRIQNNIGWFHSRKVSQPLFIMMVGDQELQSVQKEQEEILKILDRKGISYKILKANTIKIMSFLEKLNFARFFHYVGHSNQEGIPIKKGYINVKHFQSLNLSNLEVVFLNSCNSTFYDQNISHLAMGMIQAGVKHVIGFSNLIDDSIAFRISRIFWKEYFTGTSAIYEILFSIRKNLIQKYGKLEPSVYLLQYFGYYSLNSRRPFKGLKKPILWVFSIIFLLLLLVMGIFWNWYLKQNRFVDLNMDLKKRKIESSVVQDNSKKNLLQSSIRQFLNTPHPFYSLQERKKILNDILSKPISEEEKIMLIQNEMAK